MLAQFVLFDGFDPMDVIAPFETLTIGGVVSGGAIRTELVSAEGAREVPSGLEPVSLRAVGALDPERADLIVVPGAAGRMPAPGDDPDEAGEDTVSGLIARTLGTRLPVLLKAALDRPGVTVATVCGGSLIPAMAGLIDGRPATTHHLGLDALETTGAVAVDARIVDDGDLVSGAGVTSGLDVGLYLLERELGPRIAHAVEQMISHERRGVAWRSEGLAPAAA